MKVDPGESGDIKGGNCAGVGIGGSGNVGGGKGPVDRASGSSSCVESFRFASCFFRCLRYKQKNVIMKMRRMRKVAPVIETMIINFVFVSCWGGVEDCAGGFREACGWRFVARGRVVVKPMRLVLYIVVGEDVRVYVETLPVGAADGSVVDIHTVVVEILPQKRFSPKSEASEAP